ncbi:MAG: pyrroloquinoline quinone biosynthesis protein C, partial [Oceanospirillales bacterium]|nr:pyrroloquinoline quinone biosynthesis protein C [Oceanospirillales bacterium]
MSNREPMSRDAFEQALRAKGDLYHIQHPYHV